MRQIGGVLDMITRIGESKMLAKVNGQQNQFIHSISTRSATGQLLRPLVSFCSSRGIKNIDKINATDLADYIEDRFSHHLGRANTLKTFQTELSAIARLERALTHFNKVHRDGSKVIDLSSERASVAARARNIFPRRAGPQNRAYKDPIQLINAIKNPTHQLQAKLQLEGGCRTEGVGAPAKVFCNPLNTKNFRHHKTGAPLENVYDPLTGELRAAFWTVEKGGKLAYHFCSLETFRSVSNHIGQHGKIESKYKDYLKSVEFAAKQTGQFMKGSGTHGFRFNFGQKRYNQAIRAGYSDEHAKLVVSAEMSHNRADITETYLK